VAVYDFARYLNIRSAYGSSFAPGGERLAFLANITGIPQVWEVPARGGWPDQLTFFDERVSFVEFAPAGERCVFGMDLGGSERTQLYLLTSGGEQTICLTPEAPEAIHTFGGWSRDGGRIAFSSNRRSAADFDIYVRDVGPSGEGQTRRVFTGQGMYSVVGWGPDGDWLVVSHDHSSMHNDLYRLRLDGALDLLTPNQGQARYVEVNVAPDGRGLYLATDAGSDFLRPAYLDLTTLELRRLGAADWDVDAVKLSPDGRVLAIVTNQDGFSRWELRDLAEGRELPPPEPPPGLCGFLTFAGDSTALSFSLTGPQHPLDVWVYDLRGRELRQVTFSSLAGLPRGSFAAPELVGYPTFDGRTIPAYLYRPHPDSAPSTSLLPPVVIDVHGGPEGQRRVEFNPVYQYFLHRGYAVFAPNVRGSTGYGRAYSQLDDVEKRMDSVADLAWAVHWLRDSGVADARRIAVLGGSYGGFMVLAALTSYPDLWAAGIDIVGIANFVTFLENTGAWRRYLRECEYGSLERDRAFLESISPIHKVDRIRAPLMVIHGANDPRVPIGEAEQIVASVRQRGGVVEYLRFDDEGHGIVKLANRLVCYPAIAAFLDRHLAGERVSG
jgi:Tol biopolymer transport system component/dienelactone hydrolase